MTEPSKEPNPADFSIDEKAGEYCAVIEVVGDVRIQIRAADLDEARRIADERADEIADDPTGAVLDDLHDVRISHVTKRPPTFRATRNGRAIQVSHLKPGGLPRKPDERGF